MQLPKEKQPFKSIEASLAEENKYITELFSIIAFPDRCAEEEVDEDEEAPRKQPNLQGTKTSRATSISELQQRLEAIQSKKKQTFKEKLKKKDLKNQMRRKYKREERNAQKQQMRAQTTTPKAESQTNDVETKTKPIFNSEGKMVFSKFDFSGLGEKTDKKQEKDPKKILENLHKQKERLQKLEAEGEVDKAKQIKDKAAWRNAIAKAEGEKIKDDEVLLKKSVKKNEQIKKTSKKKWDKRIESVQQGKDDRQKKRQENIDKRKKSKKTTKLKKAAKRGKIIPGF